MQAVEAKRIPGLVISGFLGSGKTTLVRHLLDAGRRTGLRTAVVSNEFGELGIDQALMGTAGPAYVELEGGCVCCKLSDDLVMTLQGLWESVRPDRVIIETSGVANPYDTLINFWREPVSGWLCGDATVVVVSAVQVREGEHLDGIFEDQVSSADIIVLNKLDLVSPPELEGVRGVLREIEPDAPLIETVQARVEEAVVFPPDPVRVRPQERRRANQPSGEPHHHDDFESLVVEFAGETDVARMVETLRDYEPIRVKGFVRSGGAVKLVQGVGMRIELEKPSFEPPPDLIGRIVVIRRRKT